MLITLLHKDLYIPYPCIGRGAGTNAVYLLFNPNKGILLENHSKLPTGCISDSFKDHKISIKEFLSSKDLTSITFLNLLKYWSKV